MPFYIRFVFLGGLNTDLLIVDTVYSAGTLVIFRYVASSSTRARSCLKQRSYRAFRIYRVSFLFARFATVLLGSPITIVECVLAE